MSESTAMVLCVMLFGAVFGFILGWYCSAAWSYIYD